MIRQYAPADFGFIRALWVRSYEKSRFGKMCGRTYDELQTRLVRRLLPPSARAVVLIACDPDAPAVLWGFIAYEGSCLHYVAVVRELRGHGIARALTAGLHFDRTSHEGWRGLPWTPQEAW